MRPNTPSQSRYVLWRAVLMLWTLAVLPVLVAVARLDHPFLWKNNWLALEFIALWLLYFRIFWKARRRALDEKNALPAAHRPPGPKKQTFLWQGGFILLPVTLMAAFGFWAILRERNAVEQEAQQRAREIIQSLPAGFGQDVAYWLTQCDGPKGGWYIYLQNALSAWPENKNRKQWLADTNEAQAITNDLAVLHAAFPQWHEGPLPLVSFLLDQQPPASLQPPTWLAAMSAGQHQAWAALLRAACASGASSNLAGLTQAFQQTRPPPSALACADFMLLRARSQTLPATNAINQLLDFAGHHYDVISETGVPLRTLALAEALRRARDCGPNERLWEALQSEISSPSALSPILLDEAGRLVAGNPQLSGAVNAMRVLLADKLAQSELAAAVKQTGKLNGLTATNLWVNAMNQQWFCILSTALSGNSTIMVYCYPQSAVERGFAEAIRRTGISLPDYFGISIRLEGRTVLLPLNGGDRGDVLAEAPFRMSRPGVMAKPGSKQEGKDIIFETMPGHPQFTIQIRLADRSLLYARQRRLQFIFGVLIAASALSALIGFVAAYRAFRRQQRLSEMKSNFVSSVSHELRAPIASVRLMAENLELGKIPDAPRQREYFHFIVQECRRLSSLIENILDFSRIEQGRKQYELEPSDLAALTRTTVKLMEPYAAEKGVVLRLEAMDSPVIQTEADGRALQQALVNLIDNAVKHSPKGETVSVGIELKNGGDAPAVRLFVADHGPGIPRGEHERIFERFYRLGSELRRETQGVGIGLSVVKHIVDAHHGRVIVQSAPGQGSRFTIELPLKK
jgi:signal transduction histidine kinase